MDATTIRRLHERCTLEWHSDPAEPLEMAVLRGADFEDVVLQQHLSNFLLWHEEDRARDPEASDAQVAATKRSIDRINQRRNDLTEALDEQLLRALPTENEGAPLLSETPGMMIDRLSILALKIFHTREEVERVSATGAHRARNAERLQILVTQAGDLAGCLDEAFTALRSGRRRVKVYRQLKMYNDPDLNPVLYAAKRERG